MITAPVVSPILFGPIDVSTLRALVATAEENDDRITFASEVDAEARSERDAEFLDSVSHGFRVPEIPEPNTGDPLSDAAP